MSRVVTGAGGVVRHLAGWRRDRPDHRDLLLGDSWPAATAAPAVARIDLSAQLLAPTDQGPIGDCVAQTACELMEAREAAVRTRFSRLALYARVRGFEGTPLVEDSGAQIRDVMSVLATFGAATEATWSDDDPANRFSVAPSPESDAEAELHKAAFFYRCPTIAEILASLAQGFCVGFGFSVPASMMGPQCAANGIVHLPGPTEQMVGGHAVTAYGFDLHQVVDGAPGVLLCRNHWSASWGQAGNFVLPFGYWQKVLASDAWTLRRASV